MSHERVIKGSPVRSAGFLCATAAGGRAAGRASGDRERQAAEARDSCAGMAARDAGAVGRAGGVPAGVSGARGRGPGRTQVGWPRRRRKPDGAELCGALGDRGATCEMALDGSARPASMSTGRVGRNWLQLIIHPNITKLGSNSF